MNKAENLHRYRGVSEKVEKKWSEEQVEAKGLSEVAKVAKNFGKFTYQGTLLKICICVIYV